MAAPELFYYWVSKDAEKEFFKFCENKRVETLGPFLKSAATPENSLWYRMAFRRMEIVSIESITAAQSELRKRAAYWTHIPYQLHRRCELIQDKLKKIPPVKVGDSFLNHTQGAWTLLSQNELLLCYDSVLPKIVPELQLPKDHAPPPSQAYKKIWEALGRVGKLPSPGEKVLDLGSCPGGWTWYLKEVGTYVLSVDSAPLREDLMKDPLVSFIKKDAFKLDPQNFDHKVSWLFSDIICEPQKLPDLVQRWQKVFPKLHWVVTLKFKGPADMALVRKLQKFPHSQILHLHSNKHELMWVRA